MRRRLSLQTFDLPEVTELQAERHVLIAGGGPAGLTAACLLARRNVPVTVVEAHPRLWGGISRTEEYKGYRFDIGGHRFFSKSAEVEQLWDEILPEPMLERPRKSRIFYRGKFYSYPIRPFEALANLGPIEAGRCVASYVRARLWPMKPVRSFQDWVTNAFGDRLFSIFFKTYTEKVWGMDCRDISANWAAQRIRGLSLSRAILSAFVRRSPERHATVKTLINTFRYPRLGPGMMWDAAAAKAAAKGATLLQGARVVALDWNAGKAEWLATVEAETGSRTLQASAVISSIPLGQLPEVLVPGLTKRASAAARALRYRDFVTVALIVREQNRFDDHWIYVHDPGVRVGRIQNYKSWSPDMVPDAATACYGLEYFCNDGDDLWARPDGELVALAARELAQLGLASADDVLDGTVVRQPKAYPVYDAEYEARVGVVRDELLERFPTFHPVGRNGMHKYNNQDHAMMTAVLTVENVLAGYRRFDTWRVNDDAEYHEAEDRTGLVTASGARAVPLPIVR
jgi:protoporphyrinogen oxidase